MVIMTIITQIHTGIPATLTIMELAFIWDIISGVQAIIHTTTALVLSGILTGAGTMILGIIHGILGTVGVLDLAMAIRTTEVIGADTIMDMPMDTGMDTTTVTTMAITIIISIVTMTTAIIMDREELSVAMAA
jgi:hypothetical protein